MVRVELLAEQHLHWPELDIDLEVDAILRPDRFPLVSKVHEGKQEYERENRSPGLEQERVDDTILALLQLTLHDDRRAWKGFYFDAMDRLFEKGYILNPAGKAKSVVLTDKGLARSKELFEVLFGKG